MAILKYLRLPFWFNVSLLQHEVQELSALPWQLHFQKLHYEGQWSGIPLRSINGKTDNIHISIEEHPVYKNTAFLEDSPYLQKVLQTFQCPLRAVRLLKLNAGAIIKEHRDKELNFERGEIRLHIPVITHEDVEFYLDHERIYLKEGECWYLNFDLPHRISNNSNTDRIHLVIDAEVNDWVRTVFADPSITLKKETEDPSTIIDDATKKQMIQRFREMNTETTNRMADELEKTMNKD